jgi:hypothetical protein
MKSKMSVSWKNWALPLSVSGERWPTMEVRLLCFVFSICWGQSGALHDALVMVDTERVAVTPPPIQLRQDEEVMCEAAEDEYEGEYEGEHEDEEQRA